MPTTRAIRTRDAGTSRAGLTVLSRRSTSGEGFGLRLDEPAGWSRRMYSLSIRAILASYHGHARYRSLNDGPALLQWQIQRGHAGVVAEAAALGFDTACHGFHRRCVSPLEGRLRQRRGGGTACPFRCR